MPETSLRLTPIGIIHTPFKDRASAPRQPNANHELAEGKIVLAPGHNFEQALEDLAGFELIWIISWFHLNSGWKPKVLPPRGSRKRRGVFATRSPHRPNPLGLSIATLLEIRGRTVRVGMTDLLDGTPILDIKPYLPFAEAYPHARFGWVGESEGPGLRVKWSPLAKEQADWLVNDFEVTLRDAAPRVLERGVDAHPYRRITVRGGMRVLAIKSWRIIFSAGETVLIERIESGYSEKALKSDRTLHDDTAHRAFIARWPDCAAPLQRTAARS